ncbi:MAG: hypothetical protein N2439_06355 [Anaerolineae bacterium]|nr:hypothetical protein [Anaerolineae bacterium]
MTHATRLSADQRLTATEWAAVLARGIRADVSPGDWPAEMARLAERLSDMADARRGDAAVIRQRGLAATARRDAAMLEAVAGELELQASRLQSGAAE